MNYEQKKKRIVASLEFCSFAKAETYAIKPLLHIPMSFCCQSLSPLIERLSSKDRRSLCLSSPIVTLLLRTEHFPKFYRIIRSPVKIIHHCSILIILVLGILRPIVRTCYYNLIVNDAILIMH